MIRRWFEYYIIKKSGLFDAAYYLRHYKDVRRIDVDPLMHYINFGWRERRNPGPLFDTHYYLEMNPEVRQRNINPLFHYIRYGKKEGRRPSVDLSVASAQMRAGERKRDIPTAWAISNQSTKISPLKGLRKKVFNGWNYLRVNGLGKFFIRVIEKIGLLPRDRIRRGKSIPADMDASPYSSWYKSSLAVSTGSDKREYVSFKEYGPPATPPPVKLIAFYLPQFHPIPENDAWWGKGFTEWTNVSKAVPQFEGHYQPHLPGELGFYDLRVQEVQRRQVELAKNYGIYGFCFYYYWFAGKKLLSLPLERFIQDPAIDFPFCICWANENWTRRWDGYESDVLIRQDHTVETELNFIQEIIPLLKHKNYIGIDRHPIIIVYRMDILPNPKRTVMLWKEQCLSAGIEEPYLISAQTFGFFDPRTVGFDAAVEFPPHNINAKDITDQVVLLNHNYTGCIYPYSGKSSLVEIYLGMDHPGYKAFKTVAPGWDNEPRKPGRGDTFAFSTPEDYKMWLKSACEITKNKPIPDERIVFINAWNEWGEGAYLEPDRKFGYAYLQATYDAIGRISRPEYPSSSKWKILFVLHDAHLGGAQLLIQNIISWLRDHTEITIKLLFLDKGDLLLKFMTLGETLVLEDAADLSAVEFTRRVVEHCGAKPDLIYGNTVTVGKVYKSLKNIGSPILTHIHELETSINRYASAWIDSMCKNTDHFISVSAAVSENLKANHMVNPQVISKVHGGVPAIEHYLDDQERLSLREKLEITKETKLVVGCGRGMPFRKGADLFIRVAEGVRQKLPDQVHFLWIGDFDPNESDEKLGYWRDYLQHIQGDRDIRFLGLQSAPLAILQLADLFLLTSREDPFPLVILEAAQCKVPVVCFDGSGGAAEFVEDKAGVVVPFGDVQAMVDAAHALLTNDALRLSLGEKGYRKVNQSHTIDAIAPQILSVCRKVANKVPVVSVIVPNYNHARYLPKRLDSIFNQSFRDFEVIILDDASTDNSLEIIEAYSNFGDVTVIKNTSNSGSPFNQWITGLEIARSELIWIAESDDESDPNFLRSLIPAFTDDNVRLAYTNSWVIDSQGTITGDYISSDYLRNLSTTKWNASYKITAEEEINDGLGIKNTILNISSAIFRKPKFEQSFYESLRLMHFAGDWFFIIRLIQNGYICYEAHKYNFHRRHDESVIGNLIKMKEVEGFYKEIATVQRLVCSLYDLHATYLDQWTAYHHKQWHEFYPNANLEELKKIFPYDEIMNLIRTKGIDTEQ